MGKNHPISTGIPFKCVEVSAFTFVRFFLLQSVGAGGARTNCTPKED